MGSFHSEDVESKLKSPFESYLPPSSPLCPSFLEKQAKLVAEAASIPLGHELGRQHFLLDPSWTFINHGAFGAASRVGFSEATQWREHCERQPLRFFDRDLLPHLAHSCYTMARFIGAAPTDVALLPNATTGLNTVMRGVLEEECATTTGTGTRRSSSSAPRRIFMFDTAYGAVKKIASDIAARNLNVVVDVAPLPLPLSHLTAKEARDVIVDVANEYMHPDTSLAVFDHTTSNTALNMPLAALAGVARDRGAKVLIDGAHGLLAQSSVDGFASDDALDIATLSNAGVDFYVANCHKWFASPKAAALLWSRSGECQQQCRPLVVSHGLGQGFFSSLAWDGCRDYSSALSLPRTVDLWKSIGIRRTRSYMDALSGTALEILQKSWGERDGGRTLAPFELHGPMTLVSLPSSSSDWTDTDAKAVQDALHHDHMVECPIKCIRGQLYARISVHVYNEASDYEILASAVQKIMR